MDSAVASGQKDPCNSIDMLPTGILRAKQKCLQFCGNPQTATAEWRAQKASRKRIEMNLCFQVIQNRKMKLSKAGLRNLIYHVKSLRFADGKPF